MGTTTTPQRDQLAKRLAHDLDGAFPDLVRQTVDGLFSGVRRLAPQVAEEITQETYIRAYRALQGYGSERVQQLKVQGWLWTIALNLCRNAARTRSRRPVSVDLAAATHAPSTLDTPEDEMMRHAEAEVWERRLGLLAEPMRHAVVLRHVVGLPYAEIADALGRPTGTVKADVHRGIEKLRGIVIEEQEHLHD